MNADGNIPTRLPNSKGILVVKADDCIFLQEAICRRRSYDGFGTLTDVNADAKILTRIPNYNGIPVRKSDNFS